MMMYSHFFVHSLFLKLFSQYTYIMYSKYLKEECIALSLFNTISRGFRYSGQYYVYRVMILDCILLSLSVHMLATGSGVLALVPLKYK